MKGSRKLRPGGMVFHARWVGFRIGKDLSRGIDNGDARSGGLGNLSDDLGKLIMRSALRPGGQHHRLLLEGSLNLPAQHVLPCATDEQIERNGAGCDDD